MTLRLVSAIFFVLATSNAGAATAPRCGVNVHVPVQRVFARVDDSEAWREFEALRTFLPSIRTAGFPHSYGRGPAVLRSFAQSNPAKTSGYIPNIASPRADN